MEVNTVGTLGARALDKEVANIFGSKTGVVRKAAVGAVTAVSFLPMATRRCAVRGAALNGGRAGRSRSRGCGEGTLQG